MAEEKPSEKAGEKERPKRPPGWRNFQKVLKHVVKSPPMKNVRSKQTST
jgi:hypothetical protein